MSFIKKVWPIIMMVAGVGLLIIAFIAPESSFSMGDRLENAGFGIAFLLGGFLLYRKFSQ